MKKEGFVRWDKTQIGIERVESSLVHTGRNEEKGFFAGFPIMGSDTAINGYISVGEKEREAIVVDERNDEQLREATDQFFKFLKEQAEKNTCSEKEIALGCVYVFLQRVFPKKENLDSQLSEFINTYGDQSDPVIYLGRFIQVHIGVCRHMAIFGAFLIEKMVSKGILGGRVSVDRNAISLVGGHAWIRYTSKQGSVCIIDATKKFIGTLEQSVKEQKWVYLRPEEMIK